jgi:hypothetical protein
MRTNRCAWPFLEHICYTCRAAQTTSPPASAPAGRGIGGAGAAGAAAHVAGRGAGAARRAGHRPHGAGPCRKVQHRAAGVSAALAGSLLKCHGHPPSTTLRTASCYDRNPHIGKLLQRIDIMCPHLCPFPASQHALIASPPHPATCLGPARTHTSRPALAHTSSPIAAPRFRPPAGKP